MVLYSAHRDFARGLGQISSYNIAIFYRRFLVIVRRSVSASRVPAPRAAGFTGLITVSACLCPARACLGLPDGVIPPALLAARADSIGLFLRRGLLRERLNGYLFLVLKKRYPDGVFRPGVCGLLRLLNRGKAVRRESRRPAEATGRRGPGHPSCYPASRPRASRCY